MDLAVEIDDPVDSARRLGAWLRAFHRPAPSDAPSNPYRGVPLHERTERLDLDLAEVATRAPDVDTDRTRARWGELLQVPSWEQAPQWIHGDVRPRNLLVHEGRLSAVIDFGDLTSGDPATDLAVAWMLFPPDAREALRSAAGVDDDTWARAEGWAIAFGVVYTANLEPRMADVGHRTLDSSGLLRS